MRNSGSTYMFGSIGDDEQGRMLKEIVENDGVITRLVTLYCSTCTMDC